MQILWARRSCEVEDEDELETINCFRLLRTAPGGVRTLPAPLAGSWLAEESRKILRELDPQFDLTSSFPRLAITVIEILATAGGKPDAALVSRFLGANNPGVVKAALATLDQLDPELARARSEAVLKRDDLHAESRRALTEYLG